MLDIDSAIIFAATAHAGQKRKYTNDPYVVHTIEVMQILNEISAPIEVLIAALLHDVLEDTIVRAPAIKRRFGEQVLQLVIEMTEVPVEGNRKIRKAAEVERLRGVSNWGKTIKCADLISNTSSIVQYDPGFARVYLDEKEALLPALEGADERLLARAHETLTLGQQTLCTQYLSMRP